MQIKLSIIIPIFNVAPYLHRCLDSIINQSIKDIEIICVNDCSPDNSLSILKEYASKDKRIKIIDFEEGYFSSSSLLNKDNNNNIIKGNQGVSIARNICIQEATGEYIGFVDGDDWIDRDFYETLLNATENGKVEVVKGGVKVLDLKGKENIVLLNEKIKKDKYNFYSMFWSAIYRRDFIKENNLGFDVKFKSGQVGIFLVQVMNKCDTFKVIDDVFYHYIRNEDSQTSPILTREKIEMRIRAAEKMIELGGKHQAVVINAKASISKYFYRNTRKDVKMYVVNKMLELGVEKNISADALYKKMSEKEIEHDFPEKFIRIFNISILSIKNDTCYLFGIVPIFSMEYK